MSKRSLMLSKLLVASCLLACFASTPANSKPVQQNAATSDLDAKYKDKLVALPGLYCDQTLEFDPLGTLLSAGQVGDWEKCQGVRIRHVQINEGKLKIAAERVRLSLNCETGQVNEVFNGPEIPQGPEVSIEVELLLAGTQMSPEATMQRLFRPVELGSRQIIGHSSTLADAASGRSNGGLGGGIYHAGMGITPPVPIFFPDPEYAEAARQAKLQGTVMLLVIVGADGLVHNARVSRQLGMGLDEKAIEKVMTWRFKPAMRCGNPVAVELSIEIVFHLYRRAPDQPPPTSNIFGDPRRGSPSKSAFAFR